MADRLGNTDGLEEVPEFTQREETELHNKLAGDPEAQVEIPDWQSIELQLSPSAQPIPLLTTDDILTGWVNEYRQKSSSSCPRLSAVDADGNSYFVPLQLDSDAVKRLQVLSEQPEQIGAVLGPYILDGNRRADAA